MCWKKIRVFHLQRVTLFICRVSEKKSKECSHFSLARVWKMSKESSHFSFAGGHTFHLQGFQKMPKESSHFSLAEVWKNAKRKSTLFTCRGLKNAKKKFALFTCRGNEKILAFFGPPCKWKIFCRRWQQTEGGGVFRAAHQKLKLSVHTEHRRAVAQWKLTLMDRQPVHWAEWQAELVFLGSECCPH